MAESRGLQEKNPPARPAPLKRKSGFKILVPALPILPLAKLYNGRAQIHTALIKYICQLLFI
jgi:hypothetical protein